MRQHTSRACDHCRRRKIRCDGQSPICSGCRGFNLSCDYTSPRAKRGPKFRVRPQSTSSSNEIVATSTSPEALSQYSPQHSFRSPTISVDEARPSSPPGMQDADERGAHKFPTTDHPALTTRSSQWAQTVALTRAPGIYDTEPGPGSMLRSQDVACYRRSPAEKTHAALNAAVAKLDLSLQDIAEQCLDLAVRWGFPTTPWFHPSSLQKRIDILLPTSETLFIHTSDASMPEAYGRDPTQLENLRCFTLLTAICSRICTMDHRELVGNSHSLVRPFLNASRQMLAAFEDYDVVRPDSKSLGIRLMQSAALHNLGQQRLSRYTLSQAFRLAVDMRLADRASYTKFNEQEAQLLRNLYWIIYTSDKSAAMLSDTTAMLHDSPLRNFTENEAGIENMDDQVLLLGGFKDHVYTEAFERRLGKGIALARRVWVLGTDISRETSLLHHLAASLEEFTGTSRASDTLQQRIMSSYLTFCSLLDYTPPWLRWPETYFDAEADEVSLVVRRRMFWMQKADLLVTHYCLRLILSRQAFEQGFPALVGLTSNEDMLDLRVTELAHTLLEAIKDVPYEVLCISGESLVEKLRRFGATLLKISECSANAALASRAQRLLTGFLDTIAELDSKASDNIALENNKC